MKKEHWSRGENTESREKGCGRVAGQKIDERNKEIDTHRGRVRK